MYRNSYVEVDLDKLKYNADYFRKRSNKTIIGVIKADGYGLVDYMTATALKQIGIDFFAVSSLDEALGLRNHGINDKILILGQVPLEYMDIVRKQDLRIVTVSKDYVSQAELKDIKVHLKLNTGMNRIGIEPDEAEEVLAILKEKGADVEGVMSHFSSADSDREYSLKQYQIFKDCVSSLDHEFRYIHMAATDASLVINDDICNAQRIGLGLLGYSSFESELKPCIGLYSEAVACKQLKAGDCVSYGRIYTSDGKGYILTLPIGYADGFFRSNTDKKVFVENEYGTIVGRICMDQLMVHTDHFHPAGSKVELYGPHIDVSQRAKELGTITYELFTSLSDRLNRVYLENGEVIKVITPRIDK